MQYMYNLLGGRHEEKQRRFQQPAPRRCLRTRPVYGRRQMGHTDRHDSRVKTERTDSWYACNVHPRHSSRQTRNQERVRMSSIQNKAARTDVRVEFLPQDQRVPC